MAHEGDGRPNQGWRDGHGHVRLCGARHDPHGGAAERQQPRTRLLLRTRDDRRLRGERQDALHARDAAGQLAGRSPRHLFVRRDDDASTDGHAQAPPRDQAQTDQSLQLRPQRRLGGAGRMDAPQPDAQPARETERGGVGQVLEGEECHRVHEAGWHVRVGRARRKVGDRARGTRQHDAPERPRAEGGDWLRVRQTFTNRREYPVRQLYWTPFRRGRCGTRETR